MGQVEEGPSHSYHRHPAHICRRKVPKHSRSLRNERFAQRSHELTTPVCCFTSNFDDKFEEYYGRLPEWNVSKESMILHQYWTFSIQIIHFPSVANILSATVAAIIIGINIYFVGYYITTAFPPYWFVFVGISLFGVLYLSFIAYLVLHMLASMGFTFCNKFEVSSIQIRFYYTLPPIAISCMIAFVPSCPV